MAVSRGALMAAPQPSPAVYTVQLTETRNPETGCYVRTAHWNLWKETFFLPTGAYVRVDVSRTRFPFEHYYEWFQQRPDINWQFTGKGSQTWAFILRELTNGRHPLGPLEKLL